MKCRYPQSSRTDDTAAMVFELVNDQWVLVATNPEHPVIMERDAVRRMRR